MHWGWQQLGGVLEHSKLEVLLTMPAWLGCDALTLRRATGPPRSKGLAARTCAARSGATRTTVF